MNLGRLYGALHRCLPPSFRRTFGEEMRREAEQTLGAAEPDRARSVRQSLLRDLAGTVVREWVDELRVAGAALTRGGGMGGWSLRPVVRGLLRTPGYTAAVVVTLGLGIGANTVAVGLVDAWLLRTLPYQEPDRLVALWPEQLFSRQLIASAREELEGVESAAGWGGTRLTLQGAGDPLEVYTSQVTDNAFRTLGVGPALGRDFQPDDAVPGAEPVVILSHGLWLERFGADPDVLGRLVELGGEGQARRRVIGVMPSDHLPVMGTGVRAWVPVVMDPTLQVWAGSSFMTGIGRLAPGVDPAVFQERLGAWAAAFAAEHPGWFTEEELGRARGVGWADYLVRDVRQPLWITLGAALLILLVACANVANLVLARTAARTRELSVRAALGAGRVRVAGTVFGETALLAVAGALLGTGVAVGLARWIEGGLSDLLPEGGIPIVGLPLLAAVGLAALAAMAAGLAPALRAARRDPADALGGTRGRGDSRSAGRLQSTLAAAQLGLATVGVVSALVLGRSLAGLADVDPGIDTAGTSTFRVTAPAGAYPDDDDVERFFREAGEALQALPGVESAGFVSRLPMIGGRSRVTIYPQGLELGEGEALPEATHRLVTAGGLEALGARLQRGRYPSAEESAGEGPLPAVVNQAMVETYWPDEDPLGKTFYGRGGVEWVRVVGVVSDVREDGLDRPVQPALYIPHADWPWRSMTGVVRGVGGAPASAAVREAIWSVASGVPISGERPLDDVVRLALRPTRLLVVLAVVSGGVTLLLGGLGVYGVVAWGVSRRVRDIGVRVALGADRSRILAGEMGRVAGILALGAAVGVLGSWAASAGLRTLLYRVEPFDPLSVAVALSVLVATGALAAWLPARRAARVDPVEALRAE